MDTQSTNDVRNKFVKLHVVRNIDIELFRAYQSYIYKLMKELVTKQNKISGKSGFKYNGKTYATPHNLPTTVVLDDSLVGNLEDILQLEAQLKKDKTFVTNYIVKRLHTATTYQQIYYALPSCLHEFYLSLYEVDIQFDEIFKEDVKDIFLKDIEDIVARCKMMNILCNG